MSWCTKSVDNDGNKVNMWRFSLDTVNIGLSFGWLFIFGAWAIGAIECNLGGLIMMAAGTLMYIVGRKYWPKSEETT